MQNSFFRSIVALLVLLTIQSAFGQKEIKTSTTKIPVTRDFCFNIIKPGQGGCPVGEEIPAETPFLEAIRQRDVELVKKLISEGADVNHTDSRGFSPLLMVAGGDFELIDILLKAGADVNAESKYGATPLINSTMCSRAVKKFLEVGADVNPQNINKQTALMVAAKNGNIESVKFLLNANADISAKDIDEMTPLLHAVTSGNVVVTKFIYDNGGKNDFSNEQNAATALSIAAGNSQPEMIRFLLQTGVKANSRLKNNANALTMASMRNNTEAVKLLLEAGADPNLQGKETVPPLTWASNYGYTEIVKLLLAAKAKVNTDRYWSPLFSAAQNGHIETMTILLKAGANINAQGYEGKTALMDAAERGKVEVVKFLIENDADVNLKDRYNEVTALSWAMKSASVNQNPQINEVIQLLKNAGAIE